ncbi:MAG: DUF4974 domain-containing protein [Cytophagales bacterium]|nr:DUF4974 domain-containing protein [Cytophagales bacterium]
MSHSDKIKKALEQIQGKGQMQSDLENSLSNEEKELLETLVKKGLVAKSLRFLNQLDLDDDWDLVQKRLREVKPVRKLLILKYAAVFIGFMVLTYFFVKENLATKSELKIDTENAIILKIDNQELKVIDQGENQEIVSASGLVVGTQQGNTLVYDRGAKIEKLIYNELTVPYGKIFNLELSDGTIIHLNSGSSIKYPIKFVGDGKREVFLNGEAYFKVVKDTGHPFIVNAYEVAVEVLGTEFNVTSYEEDAEINTVLVEGSVRLIDLFKSDEEVILDPGYKGAFHKNNRTIAKGAVDLDLYTSWIKGELIFRKSPFGNMIRKLERRYNVIIINNNEELNQKKFNARFDVNIESIHDVMQSISNVTPFEFKIEADNKVIIN